jgi:hypothetical protein
MDNVLTAKDAEDFEDEVAEYEAMEQDPKRPLQDMYLGVEKFDDDEDKPVVDQPVPPPLHHTPPPPMSPPLHFPTH